MCDSINELQCKISEFLIRVDKSLEEYKFRIDILSNALWEDISIGNNLLNFISPNLLDK